MHLNFGPNKTSAKKTIALKKLFWISEPCGVFLFFFFAEKHYICFLGGLDRKCERQDC